MRSPCVNQCLYDPIKDHCTGCFRNFHEISDWYKLSDPEKKEVLLRIKARRKSKVPSSIS